MTLTQRMYRDELRSSVTVAALAIAAVMALVWLVSRLLNR